MLCLRSLQLSRHCVVRFSVALKSTNPKRPERASKSEKELIKENSEKLYENQPITARVVTFWGAASTFRKGLIIFTIGNLLLWYVQICYGLYRNSQAKKENQEQVRSYGELSVGGPFELEDTAGNVVSTETLKGNWALLYFGFTYCPDICPEQMEMMASVVDIATEEHDIDVVPLMITIDLERDTPEVLAEYVAEYSPKIIGLRGTEQQIDDVCNHYRCYRSKGQAYDDPHDYILDHTVTQYIINPEGKTVGYFMSNRTLEERVPIFLDHVKKYNENKKAEETQDNLKQEQPSMFQTVKQYFGFDTAPVT